VSVVAVPPGVVTVIGPVVASAGTVVVIWLSESIVYVAVAPPKLTADADERLLPEIVTLAPGLPVAGANPAREGDGGGGSTVAV
jgi:hypothetical protein